jgi:UDPglucose 6-dehydrogenase
MRIAVIGTGYVGLVSGACFAELGHDVTCVDTDAEKVAKISSGVPPIHEEGLPELVARHIGGRLRATLDLRDAIANSDMSVIAVGTPLRDGGIDLGFIRTVAGQIGSALREIGHYHVVVVKSTVVPGTTEDTVLPILEATSGKKAGEHFGVGMNPEFLTEGEAVGDFLRPDRIVLGGIDDRSIETMAGAYEAFADVPVVRTNPRSAEMIKYASNTLLATMISLSNELANLSAAIGDVDIPTVMKGVHLSRYLTDAEGRTAPLASFLYPGCGYGGSCLPKDTRALVSQGTGLGVPMRVLEAVDRVNRAQPQKMLDMLRRHFPTLEGLRVGVLGLAFRPGTDDMRESPAIPLITQLAGEGAEIRAFDPIATDSASAVFAGLNIKLCEDISEAVQDVDAVLLVTRWDDFADLPGLLAQQPAPPLLVDGRRMIDPQAVPRYDGIGL